jgi:hypothetical protein
VLFAVIQQNFPVAHLAKFEAGFGKVRQKQQGRRKTMIAI